MSEKVKVGAIYKHYKTGNLYQVITVGKHSESLEDIVVYKALYEAKDFPYGQMWCRPLSIWQEKIDGEDRFERISN